MYERCIILICSRTPGRTPSRTRGSRDRQNGDAASELDPVEVSTFIHLFPTCPMVVVADVVSHIILHSDLSFVFIVDG